MRRNSKGGGLGVGKEKREGFGGAGVAGEEG